MGIGFKGFRRGGSGGSGLDKISGIIEHKAGQSNIVHINCGFKPAHLMIFTEEGYERDPQTSQAEMYLTIYNAPYSIYQWASSTDKYLTEPIGSKSLKSIDNDGFTVDTDFFKNANGFYPVMRYVAIRGDNVKDCLVVDKQSVTSQETILTNFYPQYISHRHNVLEMFSRKFTSCDILYTTDQVRLSGGSLPHTSSDYIRDVNNDGFVINGGANGIYVAVGNCKTKISDYFITGLDKTTYVYTGNPIEPTVLVSGGLIEGTDYTVTYKNNIHIGTGTVIVKGIGNYTGVMTFNFTIASYQEVAVGTFTYSTSSQTHINCGFKPAYLIITRMASGTTGTDMHIYSQDYSTTKSRQAWSSGYAQDRSLETTSGGIIYSIDNDGFTMNKNSSAQTYQYIAIPENYGGEVAIGTVNYSSTESQSVNLGFKPKYLALTRTVDAVSAESDMHIYSEDYSTTKYRYAASTTYATDQNLNTTTGARIYSINNNGFTVNKRSTGTKLQYIAVGYKVDISPYINGLKKTSVLYTGSAVTSEVDTDLILGTDYTVEYSNNVNKGTATALIRGIGAYSGTVTLNYEVTDYVVGTLTYSKTDRTHINVGFKPSYLIITKIIEDGYTNMIIYSKDYSESKFRIATSGTYANATSLGGTTNGRLYSIDNDGFTINKDSANFVAQYIAIPENYGENVTIGAFTYLSSGTLSVDVGFKPKYLSISRKDDSSHSTMCIYSKDYSESKFRLAQSDIYAKDENLGGTREASLKTIDDNGFTVNKASNNPREMQYIALR